MFEKFLKEKNKIYFLLDVIGRFRFYVLLLEFIVFLKIREIVLY